MNTDCACDMSSGQKPIEAPMYDEDRDALAAEYVLGTLSAVERDQAEALLAQDAGFAETVRLWEHRLGELNVMVEAVEPAPDLWERIKTGIDGAERRSQAAAEVTPSLDASAEPSFQAVPDLLSEGLQSSDASKPTDLASTLLPLDSPGKSDDQLAKIPAPQTATGAEAAAA